MLLAHATVLGALGEGKLAAWSPNCAPQLAAFSLTGLAVVGGSAGGRGRSEKPKTAAELDKEMDDYFLAADPNLAKKVI